MFVTKWEKLICEFHYQSPVRFELKVDAGRKMNTKAEIEEVKSRLRMQEIKRKRRPRNEEKRILKFQHREEEKRDDSK